MGIVRNVVLVVLLVSIALVVLFLGELLSVPRVRVCGPLDSLLDMWCSQGDVLLGLTVLATLLFSGERKLLWALAPTLVLIALHVMQTFWDGIPTHLRTDERSAIDWLVIWEALKLWGVMLFAALATYAVLQLFASGCRRFASRHPTLMTTTMQAGRLALKSTVMVAVATLVSWTLFRLSDAYQVMQIRRDVVQALRGYSDPWVDLAVEVDADDAVNADTINAVLPLARMAVRARFGKRHYRERALALVREHCAASIDTCLQDLSALEQAGLLKDAATIRSQQAADLACAQGDANASEPELAAANAIRSCLSAGQPVRALELWNAAIRISAREKNSRHREYLLATIPADAPLPPEAYVFGDIDSRDSREAEYLRSGRAGALFDGLARVGRWQEAWTWFERLSPELLQRQDKFLADLNRASQLDATTLKAMSAHVRALFADGKDTYAATNWLTRLSYLLALANEPEAAESTLPPEDFAPDADAVNAIIDAYMRRGDAQRAAATLDRLDSRNYLKDTRGRVCIALARQGRTQGCLESVDRLSTRDRAKVLAITGANMLASERRATGERFLDRAEGLAIENGAAARDAELLKLMAQVGRLRRARLLASELGNEERAETYRAVLGSIVGWRRDLGIALAKLADRVAPLN